MTDENPLFTEHFRRCITRLEEQVVSRGYYPRWFDFMPRGIYDREFFDPYHPEFGYKPSKVSVWQVILGDVGMLVCEHTSEKTNQALFKRPNFTELFKDFEGVKAQMKEQGLEPSEPILCWILGLIHAFMAENPNVIQCEATLTGTSGIG
jgi:hypothetical protein